MWASIAFGSFAVVFLWKSAISLWHLRWVRRLPLLSEDALDGRETPPSRRVRCSVVIPARDEELRIGQTVRRVLAQRGAEVEVIAVDDRSGDRTGEILRGAAAGDTRLRVISVDTLPEGWLGKCHACHLGAEAATGDWILFTDADCWLSEDVVARAIRAAERAGADHVTLGPGIQTEDVCARVWHLLFCTTFLDWFAGVNRDRSRAFLGIGAFNLVRADAYRESGGYRALALTVVDDVKLGLLLRRAGKRTRGFLGADDVVCDWGATVGQAIRVLEKNYFAALDFRTWLAIAACLLLAGTLCAVGGGLLAGTPAGIAAGLSPLFLILPAGVLSRRIGWPVRYAALMPFMLPVFLYALLNSTVVTLRQGGVRWRDTFYPLSVLRKGNVR